MNRKAKSKTQATREGHDLRQRTAQLDAIVPAHNRAADTLRFQANLLDAVEQAVIVTELDGTIVYWNRFAETLYGWSAPEVIGRNILDVTPAAATHARATELMARLRQGESWSSEFLVRRRDGTTFLAQVSDSPVYDSDGQLVGIIGLSSDITARKRAERERTLQYAVGQVLAESATLADAAPRLLQAIGEGLEWDYGALWTVHQRAKELACVATWHTPARAFAGFEAITRQRSFAPGTGLPGRVWNQCEPVWIADVVIDTNFPRAAIARAEGLHAAFGFPIRFGHNVLGVVEFFSDEIQAPDTDLLQLAAAIGTQIGQFMERKQVEAALRASEAQTRAILEAALDSIITIDHTGRVLEFNPAAEQTFGYDCDAVLGRELADLVIPPHLRDQHRQGLEHYLATGEGPLLGKRIELPALRADGTQFPADLAIARIPTDGPPLFTGFLRDITERRQAEEQLRRSEQALTDFFENATEGLHWVGPDGRILRANRAELELLGYTSEEYIGHHIAEFHADAAAIKDMLERLARGETLHNYEARLRCRDGSIRYVLINSNVFWEDGQFIHTRCFTRDITKRKLAEAALRESEERFRALANAVPSIVWTAAPDGTITFANAQWFRYCGLTPEENARSWPQLVLHPDDQERCLTEWNRALQLGTDYEIEVRNRRYDGEYRWFLTRAVPTRDVDGRITAWFGTTTDIHDRKLAEEERAQLLERERAARAEAQEAVWMRDVFFSVASHELKTPLTSLMGQAQLLHRRALRDGMRERDLRSIAVIAAQASRLNKMILALLDVSRLETGQLSIERTPFDLQALARRVAAEVQPTLEKHTVTCSGSDLPVIVEGDELRLEQVLQNLVQNAIKYSPTGGQVTVQVTQRGTTAYVAVTDEGMGIPQKALPRLFGRFYRATNAEAQQIAGMGIGLFVVKEIVTMHGGTVEVESTEGIGSTFTVCLPALEHLVADRTPFQ